MRKTFLMCPPVFFDVQYVINPWMTNNISNVDKQLASKQWSSLYNTIKQFADVELINSDPSTPDMVFTANAGMFVGDRTIVISKFLSNERRAEEAVFKRWFRQKGYQVDSVPSRVDFFEGAGDGLVDAEGVFWLGYGKRSTYSAIKRIARMNLLEHYTLELVDDRFYHLDTCFCPLTSGEYLIFPEAFKTLDHIHPRHSDKFIVVSEDDALKFACNAVCIDDHVILPKCSTELQTKLQTLGYIVHTLDLSEFIKAGGAAKCLTLELR